MKTLLYIFDRDEMKDPFDDSLWVRDESRTLNTEHALRLLQHEDCWMEVAADAYGPPVEADEADEFVEVDESDESLGNAKRKKDKEEDEEFERGESTRAVVPNLDAMTKDTIIQFAKGNFNMDLDDSMKKAELIDAVRARVGMKRQG